MNSTVVLRIAVLCNLCVVGMMHYSYAVDQALIKNALAALPEQSQMGKIVEPYQSTARNYRNALVTSAQKRPYDVLRAAENFLNPTVGNFEQWQVGLNVDDLAFNTIRATHAALMRGLTAELQSNATGLVEVEKKRVVDIVSGETPTAISPAITGGPLLTRAAAPAAGGGGASGGRRGKKRKGKGRAKKARHKASRRKKR